MTEPATGGVAATIAVATSASGVALLSTLNSIPMAEYVPGTIFAMIGAVAWQFISAQAAREKAAENGVSLADRPRVDLVTVGYAILGAPLVSGALIFGIHMAGGNVNLISIPGFLLAGAAGPKLVIKVVGIFLNLIPSTKGDQPK